MNFFRNFCLLLLTVVKSVNLSQNKQLSALLKEYIPPIYHFFISKNRIDLADIVVESLYYILAREKYYMDDSEKCQLQAVWDSLFLDKVVNFLQIIFKKERNLKEKTKKA